MAAARNNFTCPNCGGNQAKDAGDGMLQCYTCGMQTPVESASQNWPKWFPKGSRSPHETGSPRKGLGWRRLIYLPVLCALGLTGYYLVQSIRSGTFGQVLPNIFSSNGDGCTWTSNDQGVYIGKDGNPGMFIIGERRVNGSRAASPSNGPCIAFYSLPDYKKVNSQKLELPQLRDKWSKFEVRPAGKGLFYVLLSEERLFLLNAADFSLRDITETVLAHPELGGSVGKIKTYSMVQTAAFTIQMAGNKTVYYDAPANRIYAKLSDILPQTNHGLAPDTGVGFAFSLNTSFFPKATKQLLRYVAVKPGSIVATPPYFKWTTPPGISAFDKDAAPILEPSATVLSFENFGPQQPYHNARVLYWDADLVMIVSTDSPDPGAPQSLQSLNAKTGAVLFTLPLPHAAYITQVVRYQEGFLLKDVASVFMVSKSGALVKALKIQ